MILGTLWRPGDVRKSLPMAAGTCPACLAHIAASLGLTLACRPAPPIAARKAAAAVATASRRWQRDRRRGLLRVGRAGATDRRAPPASTRSHRVRRGLPEHRSDRAP